MLNKVILVGRITRDPELRYTPNGLPVAQFSVACDRPKSGGERETDFIDCVVWRQTAEFVAKYATKGRLVGVDGRLQVRNYETQDGQKKRVYEVVANDVRLLDSKRDASSGGGGESFENAVPAYNNAPPGERAVPAHAGGGGSNFEDDIPF